MKFCMVTTFYPPSNFGGDGLFVQALAHALARRGHQVTVVHCEDAYRIAGGQAQQAASDRSASGDVEVVTLRSALGGLSPLLTQQFGRPLLKARALQAVLARGFDVVNFHNISLVGGPGVLQLAAPGAIKLYTLHEHWWLCPTHVFWKDTRRRCDGPTCLPCSLRSGIPPQLWRYGSLRERALAHVDALLAPSRFTADLHRTAGVTRPVHVLPLFTRTPSRQERDTAGGRSSRGAPFLYVGRLTPSKGIVELLETLASTAHVLEIAGDGELRDALERRYASHPRIRFLGRLGAAELARAYARARAVIVPSLAPETFGLSVIEAMSFGTPVIARDSGGCAEIVADTGCGAVYSDSEQLKVALDRLAHDHALHAGLSQRAAEQFHSHYTEQHYVAGYLALIASIATGHRTSVAS